MSGSQDNNQSRSSSSSAPKTNWDPLLSHSSAIGILKPGVVFNVFSTSPSSATTGSSSNTSSMLPPPRLVRTSHTPEGTSVFAADGILVPRAPFGPQSTAFTILDVRSAVPVDNLVEPADTSEIALPRCPEGGVVAVVSDIPPGGGAGAAPMHRTQSLDYAVVVSGEIVLGLDGGDERTVRAGEFILQAGTNHTWTNRAAGPCRILFVMVSAREVVLSDGSVLKETSFESLRGKT